MLDFFKTNKQKQEEKDKANKAIYLRLKTELKSKVEEITELMNDNDSTIEKKAEGVAELYKLKDDLSSKWMSISLDTRQIIHREYIDKYIDKDIDNNIDALKMKLFNIYAESVNGKVVNILDVKKFDRGCVYYKFGPGYALRKLGKYDKSYENDPTKADVKDYFVFKEEIYDDNDNVVGYKENKASYSTKYFIEVDVTSNAGGKPRMTTRRRKNKKRLTKRRSSKK
jgi:hypothetical protein